MNLKICTYAGEWKFEGVAPFDMGSIAAGDPVFVEVSRGRVGLKLKVVRERPGGDPTNVFWDRFNLSYQTAEDMRTAGWEFDVCWR